MFESTLGKKYQFFPMLKISSPVVVLTIKMSLYLISRFLAKPTRAATICIWIDNFNILDSETLKVGTDSSNFPLDHDVYFGTSRLRNVALCLSTSNMFVFQTFEFEFASRTSRYFSNYWYTFGQLLDSDCKL